MPSPASWHRLAAKPGWATADPTPPPLATATPPAPVPGPKDRQPSTVSPQELLPPGPPPGGAPRAPHHAAWPFAPTPTTDTPAILGQHPRHPVLQPRAGPHSCHKETRPQMQPSPPDLSQGPASRLPIHFCKMGREAARVSSIHPASQPASRPASRQIFSESLLCASTGVGAAKGHLHTQSPGHPQGTEGTWQH